MENAIILLADTTTTVNGATIARTCDACGEAIRLNTRVRVADYVCKNTAPAMHLACWNRTYA